MWFDIDNIERAPEGETIVEKLARETATVSHVLGAMVSMFTPEGLVEIVLISKQRIMDALDPNRGVDPRATIIACAKQRIAIVADQHSRGLTLGEVYSEWAYPPQTQEDVERAKNTIESLKVRAGARTATKDEGGVPLTAGNLLAHDGKLREGIADSKMLVRGPMSTTDAGSQAGSAAGNSLGVGGRVTDRNRRQANLNWGRWYNDALSFIPRTRWATSEFRACRR